uniref:Sucrose phosphatase-like domain-containing protein n=1 Tax=Rhodosorus marinus TaxID=101924 RepID=A0A7S0G694_9RHOD
MDDTAIKVVFSDIDGTLVHYPKDFERYAELGEVVNGRASIRYSETGETRECRVLESLTGGKAYISERTIALVDEIRAEGVQFVLITGARSSTYDNRRPNLPKVDFEVFENGGRCIRNGEIDMQWTRRYENVIGDPSMATTVTPQLQDAAERVGPLWDLYRRLSKEGWALDARDYVTNFRVDVTKSTGKTTEDFERLKDDLKALNLATSFNLGKADIYPSKSGKANAASYVLRLLELTPEDSISMFDDDNDLELGALTGRAFLPGVTHPSVAAALRENPRWEVMPIEGFLGTEAALERILRAVKSANPLPAQKVLTAV